MAEKAMEMTNGNAAETGLLARAMMFAAEKHAPHRKKGGTIPYLTHVMEAMEIVSRLTEDEEVRAAAVLHDVVEDAGVKPEELEALFNRRVRELVMAESEDKREGLPADETWRDRKSETIEHLKTAGTDVRMIALGDKLANVRAMTRDHGTVGEKLWERFNVKDPRMHGWYYGSLAEIFGTDETIRNTPEYREYAALCEKLFGRYGADGNLIDPENVEKSFLGVPENALKRVLKEYTRNPAWNEYWRKAPSRECALLIALEFFYSETGSDAAVKAMETLEKQLTLEDWMHLDRYCGNNPRRKAIRERIAELEKKNPPD